MTIDSDQPDTIRNKNITDFFLLEYDKLAQAHFSAHENLSKWVRFYFLVIAAPISFFLLIQPSLMNHWKMLFPSLTPTYISVVPFFVGIVGIFMSLIIFDIRLDAALYARSVNGIRKYFFENNNLTSIDVSQYVVMSTNVNKPSLTKLSMNAIIFIVMFAIINALYICVGSILLGTNIYFLLVIFLIIIFGHLFGYILIGRHKKKHYVRDTSS